MNGSFAAMSNNVSTQGFPQHILMVSRTSVFLMVFESASSLYDIYFPTPEAGKFPLILREVENKEKS